MAYRLEVDLIDADDDEIHVTYTFWGATEKEARSHFRAHQGVDQCLAAAVREDRIAEDLEEISEDELPEVEDDDDGEDDDV